MNRRSSPPSIRAHARLNARLARAKWGANLSRDAQTSLWFYSHELRLSVQNGDLLLIDGHWYVTHSGLLRLAKRRRCRGIDVVCIPECCDPSSSRWAFKATVYTSQDCKGFAGHGDADPSNVSPLVRGAEMRVAETRAVNRALRKAYGIGICSVEELGSFSGPLPPAADLKKPVRTTDKNGKGHHPLRDRLCLLIRQHQLNAALVKAYAADYCDVPEMRQASREQVATFIKHLAEYAQSDREGLLCQLNSYAPKPVTAAAVTTPNDSLQPDQEKARGAA
jgi:hypothetical protein